MKKIVMIIVVASAIATSHCCAQANTTTLNASIIKELEKAEQAMFEASSKGDSAAFRKICGIDYYTINADGTAHNLEETIPNVPRFKGSSNVFSEQTQRVYGNFALRTGRAKIYMFGKQVAEILFTTGWVYRDGRWQFIHWQGTLAGMMLEPFKGKMALGPPPTAEEQQKQK
jgi:hypothetical protein